MSDDRSGCRQKVVLITGAAVRLGAATTRFLHQQDWNILVHCRHSRDAADALANELNQTRADSCHVLQADLAKDDDIAWLAQESRHVWGRVDALINNASGFYPTPVGSITATDWNDLFASNARAPLFLAQALAPELKLRHGVIINLIDIHAEKPLKDHTVYCMAKASLAMLTQSLAKELAPDIRVNGVAPGAILWPSAGTLSQDEQAAAIRRIPLQRMGSPDDIARTIAFLLDDAPYITGQIITVDGGRSL
jgi:pteridine reductase